MSSTVDSDPLRALLSIPRLKAPRISNGRDRVGFYSNATGRFELYSLPLTGAPPEQLTHGDLPRTPTYPFVWSHDDQGIVFNRDQNGDEQHDLYRVSTASGQVDQLTADRTCQRIPWEVSPDNRWLLFLSDQGVKGEDRKPDFWRLPFGGGEAERVTHHAQPPYPWYTRNFYRPDGRKIAYGASDAENLHDVSVFVAESDGSGSRLVYSTKPGCQDIPGGWSPDGRSLSISTDANDRIRTGILDVEGGEVRWLVAGPYDEIPVEFSPDGRRLMTYRTTGLRVVAAVRDLVSDQSRVSPFHLCITDEAAFTSDSRRVVAVSNSSNEPNQVVRWELASGRLHALWSPPVGEVAPGSLVPGEIVRFPSFDGRAIEALLFVPPGSGQGLPRPAIVNVHGGPTWQWFDEYDPVIQFMVSQGFVLLLPNIRGSTGYGAEFRDSVIGDVGGKDLEDLAASAAYLRSLTCVDPERIGITGISYGGYMTYMALTKQPEIWGAGCAEAGITDWLKGTEVSLPGIQVFHRQLLGDSVEHAALWAERSPVNFVSQMRAPLMIVHGVNDPRCPILHARLFRDALLQLGRHEGQDFEYHEYSDVGHGSEDSEEKVRSVVPMMDFFQRRLGRETPGN